MRVEVLKPFWHFSRGQVIEDMPNNQARFLIDRGLVREAELPPRGMRSPADRMMRASETMTKRPARRSTSSAQ